MAVCDTPTTVAVIVTLVATVVALVLTGNVVEGCPAGIVTVTGKSAIALPLVSVTVASVAAVPPQAMVAVAVAPPTTVVGL